MTQFTIPSNRILKLDKSEANLEPLTIFFEVLLGEDSLELQKVAVIRQENDKTYIKGNAAILGTTNENLASIIIGYVNETFKLVYFSLTKEASLLDEIKISEVSFKDLKEIIELNIVDDDGFYTPFSFRISGAMQLSADVSIPISFTKRGENYYLESDLSNNESIQLSHLFALIGAENDLSDWLPDSIRNGNVPKVNNLSATFKPSVPKKLTEVGLELVFYNDVKWPIIPGVDFLSVGNIIVKLNVEYPLEAANRFATVEVSGDITIGSGNGAGVIEIDSRWPDLAIKGKLKEQGNLEIGKLLSQVNLPIPWLSDGGKNLEITDLNFSAEPHGNEKSFSMDITVSDALEFSLSNIIALKELNLSFRMANIGSKTEIYSSVDAKALLGKNGIELDCGGSYPEGQFYFSLNPDTPIHLHDIVSAFFGDHGGLPEGLAITELSGQYNQSTKDLNFSVSIGTDVPWEIVHDFSMNKIRLEVSGQGTLIGNIYGSFNFGKGENQLTFSATATLGDGWSFEATFDGKEDITIKKLCAAFDFAKPNLPNFIDEDLHISEVALSFKSPPPIPNGSKPGTATNTEKHFRLSGSDTVNGAIIQFELKLDITYPEGKENIAFSGHLTIEDENKKKYDFDIVQQKDEAGALFLAVYHQENPEDSIDIGKLLEGLGVTDAPSMNLSLQDVFFVHDKIDSNNSLNLVVADIGAGMNLSNLPLVGKILPKDATVSIALRVLYASADYEAFLDNINKTLPTGISQIVKPDEPKGKDGFDLIANINIGEHTFHLELPIHIQKKEDATPSNDKPKQEIVEKEPEPGTTTSTTGATPTPKAAPTTPGTSPVVVNDGITWFKIGKTFGPVIFNRIGLAYKKSQPEDMESKLFVYPDAALSMGGLTFTLNGLSVSSPISDFKPIFDLKGIGLDFAEGPIEIGASFLRRKVTELVDGKEETFDEYDGMAIIKTESFSISALGSYAYVDGNASLFIYAYLDKALGGPAFFNVEGLAAAFGYNRSFLMPTIDQVSMFPLVRQVMSGEAPDDSDPAALLTQQLDAISHYIPPSIGEIFIAIGVKFNSFKLLDSFALLSVSFGNRVEIDLLGQTNIIVPSEIPEGVSPLAEIKIQLMAKFIPEEGFLGVQAQLTKDSYVLSKDCHLTGGAAFYSWFKDQPGTEAKAGDFVVTMGGYHPSFNVPSHYPQVPRLGVNWQVAPELSIKGDMYFALCAHAFMAGGHLEALYESGPLKAWFKAGADFLISWQPYHYDAEIYLDLGASYTYHFFGTHHITLDLGADVHIWGPEFAGKADIHILIFDITVAFGPDGKTTPDPISWDDFKKKCLPEEKDILSAAIAHGQHGVAENKVAIVNPKELTINVNSAVPVSKFESEIYNKDGMSFGIAPMEVVSGIESKQTITITKEGKNLLGTEMASFHFEVIKKKLPAALWGNSFSPDLNTKEKTIELVTGVKITTAEPTKLPDGGVDFKSIDDLLDWKPEIKCSSGPIEPSIGTFSETIFIELLAELGLGQGDLAQI